MSKIIAVAKDENNIKELLKLPIDGIMFSIKDLSVNSSYYITIPKLKELIPEIKRHNITIFISLNKIMHNKDLPLLETTLKELNDLNIDKILFYDLSILSLKNKLNINKDLVIFNDHSNASIYSHEFYKSYGVNTSLITSDITIEEIINIKNKTNMNLIVPVYGHIPIMYSRRYLLTSYFDYIKKDKDDEYYYLKDQNNSYIIKEEDYGTSIYNNKIINLDKEYNDYKNIFDYVILYSEFIDNKEYLNSIKHYIDIKNNKISQFKEEYKGFAYEKTIYKVK